MARIIGGTDRRALPLAQSWEVACVAPGAELASSELAWTPATVPGTAASAMRAVGTWSYDARRDFDAHDYVWRARFAGERVTRGRAVLALGGLATLADVSLNGDHVLASTNMFHSHQVDATALLRDENEIVIRCRSLGAELRARRPRPRWRAGLVSDQQLRWFRTSLLGRMPAWSPPAAPVGPWRPIILEHRDDLGVEAADVRARVEGTDGIVDLVLRLRAPSGSSSVLVEARVGDARAKLACAKGADGAFEARGSVRVSSASLWWPHTHGAQPLYDVAAEITAGDARAIIELGHTGFRTIDEIDATARDGFGLRVNGERVFCRGACWTPLDVVSLASSPADLRAELTQARAAGMNMLRLSGTMIYEDDAFHALCDELGILVWQDLMFASMDYPGADAVFVASAAREVRELVDRLQTSPSLAVVSGGSELEQQPAMLGAPLEQWQPSAFFAETMPREVHALRKDLAYVTSSPTGGTLPFHADARVAHYFGVGAYLRPLDDARRARVRFAAECLAFANVPCDETIESVLKDGEAAPLHPAWKARVPRDRNTGWDFDDVRDHYVRSLFGADTDALRYADVARYLALGRVATGEIMARTYGEWRREGSSCNGAIIWLYRDLWPGAGWGVVDAHGRPKSAYYFLRRALAPIAIDIADEGLNGVDVHAHNETDRAIAADLRVALFRGESITAEATVPLDLPARGSVRTRADGVLPHFSDVTYAYRFGPPGFDVAYASLRDRSSGTSLATAHYFPGPLPAARRSDLAVEATAEPLADGAFALSVRAKRFAFAVAIDARCFVPDDDFFDVAPCETRLVMLRPRTPGARLNGSVSPLNAESPTRIVVTPRAP